MKEKSDFIEILEKITRQFPVSGRVFAGDNSCGISDKKDVEIYQNSVFDLPLTGEKRVSFPFKGRIREEILRPGDALFTPAGCWKCTKWDLPHELFCFIMTKKYLRCTYVDYRCVNADFHRPICQDFFHTRQQIPQLMHEQVRLLTEYCSDYQKSAAAAMMVLAILNLGLELLYQDVQLPHLGKAQHNYSLIMQYLRENYTADITRRDVAKLFSLNECYISRLFKEQCGKSFSDALRELRMRHASFLLTRTNLPVAEIAERCSYSSLQTFTLVFRQYSGLPPARYRLEKADGRNTR